MRHRFALVLLLLPLLGCHSDPPQSGGRTAAYWAEVLQQPNLELRRKAATKLGPLILIDKVALPALLEALKDSDAQVRSHAARSLGVYTGPKAPEVLPALRAVQQHDADAAVRKTAAVAIAKLEAGLK